MEFSSALRDKHEGSLCYIVGKGPSIQKPPRFEPGSVVIAINEACEFVKADYSIQQDGKPQCMVRPQNGETLLLSERSASWFLDYTPRLVYSQTRDLGVQDKIITAVSALKIAVLMGCRKVIFVGFDALTTDDATYPPGLFVEPKNDLRRFKRYGEVLKLHLQGIPAALQHPDGTLEEWRSADYTIITLTGDRHLPFKLCRKYVLRQTVLPCQWIVIDDGKTLLQWPQYAGADYHARVRGRREPDHTIKLNMLEALKHVRTNHVIIMEDDDWYAPDYCEKMLALLDEADLVGETGAVYCYWSLSKVIRVESEEHAALFKTAFTSACIPLVQEVCKTIKGPLIDIRLWKKWEGTKLLVDQLPVAVGMKGLPGRQGTTSGWKSNRKGYYHDTDNEYLRKIIGEDIEDYMTLFPQRKTAKSADLTYEQEEDDRYSWLYKEGPYAKPGISLFRIGKFVDWAKRTTDLEHQTIVDLGCGRAELSHLLPFKTYTGVDISSFQTGKNIVENKEPNVEFMRHSISALPFESMQFDVAICCDVMEHVPESMVDRVLKEMFRIASSVMLVIDCVPAKLEDQNGKNLHCTVRKPQWWLDKIRKLGITRYEDWQDHKLTLFCGSGYKTQGIFPDQVRGVRLRRHPDGSVWITRRNHYVEQHMDNLYLRCGRELRWHYPIDEPQAIKHLKGKYVGKPCYIIGKGPSLDHLSEADLGDGPVIALNESVHKAEQIRVEDLFLMQQDTGINCRPKIAVPLLYYYIKHLYPEVKKRYIFTDTDFGRMKHGLTVLVAIAAARYFGCRKIVLVCFDASMNRETGYAQCVGHQPVNTPSGDSKRFLTHRRLILAEAKDMEVEWVLPTREASAV